MAIKAVFGGATLQPAYMPSDDSIREVFAVLKKEGVSTIDTARLYGESEATLGRFPEREGFTIDTKLPGGFGPPGHLTKEHILADTQNSIDTVKVKQFDIFYFHAPDPESPIEESLEAMNEAYKKGLFRRFGLSNFSAEQVQNVYDICKSKGYVLPSVYQGNYSAVARKTETQLFPTLRKLGFSFYAYSPIAGGFLTKTKEQITSGEGRWNKEVLGGLYAALYGKPEMLEVLDEWHKIAEKEGISKAELAYRWVAYHSLLKEELGDAVIFGASKVSQISQTVQALKKGPLSKEAADAIEAIWTKVESVSPLDNYHR